MARTKKHPGTFETIGAHQRSFSIAAGSGTRSRQTRNRKAMEKFAREKLRELEKQLDRTRQGLGGVTTFSGLLAQYIRDELPTLTPAHSGRIAIRSGCSPSTSSPSARPDARPASRPSMSKAIWRGAARSGALASIRRRAQSRCQTALSKRTEPCCIACSTRRSARVAGREPGRARRAAEGRSTNARVAHG